MAGRRPPLLQLLAPLPLVGLGLISMAGEETISFLTAVCFIAAGALAVLGLVETLLPEAWVSTRNLIVAIPCGLFLIWTVVLGWSEEWQGAALLLTLLILGLGVAGRLSVPPLSRTNHHA